MLLVFIATMTFAAELEEGRLRLTLHEQSGRFSLAYREDLGRQEYTPLLFARDPRSSALTVTDGEQVYRLGDAGSFTVAARTTGDSPGFTFRSGTLEVRQSFSFVSSAGARLTNGVRMEIAITNVSEEARPVGLRMLIDTYLSEGRGAHFRLSDGRDIESEMQLRSGEIHATGGVGFWVSPSSETAIGEGQLGLQYSLAGSGVTVPERVVFANWKRLSDSRYDFTVRRGRRFSQLPYSIDDSAVAVYYGDEQLEPGQSRTVTTYLGNADPEGYVSSGEESNLARTLNSVGGGRETGGASREALLEDVVATDQVLREIDRLLSDPANVTAEDLELITSILNQLEARKDDLAEQ